MSQTHLLAIESAGTLCSVALSGFDKPVFLQSLPGQKHTEVLLGLVQDALDSVQAKLSDVDAIAYSAGPGAFTGLRVACGIAQGFGWALDKKLIEVCNLQALALDKIVRVQEDSLVLVATDARMHECYTAVYQNKNGSFTEIRAPFLSKPEAIPALIEELSVSSVCGNAFTAYEVRLPESVTILSTEDCTAAMLLNAAQQAFEQGQTVDADKASLLYVRNHVAQTIAERQAAKAG